MDDLVDYRMNEYGKNIYKAFEAELESNKYKLPECNYLRKFRRYKRN